MGYAWIIDDDPQIRRLLEIALARVGGWRVALAESLQEASSLPGSPPDVMLVDVMLGQSDGRAAIEWQREGRLPAAPIVFVTALVREEQRSHYRSLGAIGVIEKPFDPMKVASMLEQLLRDAAR